MSCSCPERVTDQERVYRVLPWLRPSGTARSASNCHGDRPAGADGSADCCRSTAEPNRDGSGTRDGSSRCAATREAAARLVSTKPWLRPALESHLPSPPGASSCPRRSDGKVACGGQTMPPSMILGRRAPNLDWRLLLDAPTTRPGADAERDRPQPGTFGSEPDRDIGGQRVLAIAPPPTDRALNLGGPSLEPPDRPDPFTGPDDPDLNQDVEVTGTDHLAPPCERVSGAYWNHTSFLQCVDGSDLPGGCSAPGAETLDATYGPFEGRIVNYDASVGWEEACRFLTQDDQTWLEDVRSWSDLTKLERAPFVDAALASGVALHRPDGWAYLGNVAIQLDGAKGADALLTPGSLLLDLLLAVRMMWRGVDMLVNGPLSLDFDPLGDGGNWYADLHRRAKEEPVFIRFTSGDKNRAWSVASSRVMEIFAGTFHQSWQERMFSPIRSARRNGRALCCGSWESDAATMRSRLTHVTRWAGTLAHEIGHNVWNAEYGKLSFGEICAGPDLRTLDPDAVGDGLVVHPDNAAETFRHWHMNWLGEVVRGLLYGGLSGMTRSLWVEHRDCCGDCDKGYGADCCTTELGVLPDEWNDLSEIALGG